MAFTASKSSGGNASGKSATVSVSALAWEITESIADSMLHTDATFWPLADASPAPVVGAVFGELNNRCSVSEACGLTVTLFSSCRLPLSFCCGLLDNTGLEPCIRSYSSTDLSFGGLLQPQPQRHAKCQHSPQLKRSLKWENSRAITTTETPTNASGNNHSEAVQKPVCAVGNLA